MNDRHILAAALRWHTIYVKRLAIGAEYRRYKLAEKRITTYSSVGIELSERLTATKRTELAALRELAKICATVRVGQREVTDADVVNLPLLLHGD